MAARITPLPSCVDLAHRLQMAARDLVKPEIPMLAVRGIPTDGTAGIVVFRVPRSRLAPHRLEIRGIEKECYKRVRDRTEAMTMREIQDLTFAVARGADRIEQRFSELGELFITESRSREQLLTVRRLAIGVSALPVSADINLDRVHDVEAIRPQINPFNLIVNNQPQEIEAVYRFNQYRAVLRGTRGAQEGSEGARVGRVFCDGAVSYYLRHDASPEDKRADAFVIWPSWVYSLVLNVCDNADRIRAHAGAEAVEYGMRVRIFIAQGKAPLMTLSNSPSALGQLQSKDLTLPDYSVGRREERARLLSLIRRDLNEAAGVPVAGEVTQIE